MERTDEDRERNSGLTEEEPFVPKDTPQNNCRRTRLHHLQNNQYITGTLLSYILRFLFWFSGYSKRATVTNRLYCVFLFIVCWYQVIYEFYVVSACPEFNCTPSIFSGDKIDLEYISHLSAAIGSACSYTLMLLCLKMISKRQSNCIAPSSGLQDMPKTKIKIMFVVVLVSSTFFATYFFLFLYIEMAHRDLTGFSLFVYIFSLSCEFVAQWVGLVSLYAFSCSICAIGKSLVGFLC